MNIESILKEKKSQIAELQAEVKAIEKVINLLSGVKHETGKSGSAAGMTKAINVEIERRAVGSTFTRREISELLFNQFTECTKERFDSSLSNALFRLVRSQKLSITRGETATNGFQAAATYTKL